jgi:hypothetical protein
MATSCTDWFLAPVTDWAEKSMQAHFVLSIAWQESRWRQPMVTPVWSVAISILKDMMTF